MLSELLTRLGEKSVDDKRVVRKFLRVVPARYNQIAVVIEMFCDLDTLMIEWLIGRLRVAEDRFVPTLEKVTKKVGGLLMMEDEWMAKYKSRLISDTSSSSSGHKSGGRYVRRDKQSGAHGSGDARNSGTGLTSMGTPWRKGRCNKCKIYGHFAREYKTKPKEERKEVVHHVGADLETRALLVA